MKSYNNKIFNIFLNIITSGKYSRKNDFLVSDYLIRYTLMNIMVVFGCIFLVVLSVKNRNEWSTFAIVINSIATLILLGIFILARTKTRQYTVSLIGLIFWMLFCVLNIWYGKGQGANFVYIFILPILGIILLGMRTGVILSVILLCITAAEMFIPGVSHFSYHVDVSNRVVIAYFLILIPMIAIEITRKTKDQLIEKQSRQLKNFNDNLQKMVEEKTQSVLDLQNALLKTMAELVECRDDVTGGHIERTQHGIKILLDEMKRSGVYREEIEGWNTDLILQSCQLHDIGKISISDNILKKPAELNKEEFEEMKKHVSFGEQIIAKIETLTKESDFLKYANIFASSHHEKWDGSGYYRGLKKNEIPLLGRVMAIADVYDALVSERPYKKAFTHEDAVKTIIKLKGIQFDPLLVDVFIRAADRFKKSTTTAKGGGLNVASKRGPVVVRDLR